MGRKLYVGNLPYSATEQSLREAFAASGTVDSVSLITDRDTGQSKGFGFVEMATDAEAQAATQAMNGRRSTAARSRSTKPSRRRRWRRWRCAAAGRLRRWRRWRGGYGAPVLALAFHSTKSAGSGERCPSFSVAIRSSAFPPLSRLIRVRLLPPREPSRNPEVTPWPHKRNVSASSRS